MGDNVMFKTIRNLLLICLVSGSATAASVDDIDFMTENYPPFNFEKNGNLQGISVDTLALMLKRVGSKQTRKDIQLLPWARSYIRVQSQPNTCLFLMSRTEKREMLFKWVGPVIPNTTGLIARKDRQIEINSVQDLQNYTIGTIRDDIAELDLVNAGVSLNDMERVAETILNIKKLNLGRIDLWAYGENIAMWELKAHGFNPADYESLHSFSSEDAYFAFHKDTPDTVLQQLQAALDAIKAEGEFDKILDQYLQ
jgi:polar amino acid transport system substrate-binding protein